MIHLVPALLALCAVTIPRAVMGVGEFAHLFTPSEYQTMTQKRVRREIRDLSSAEWDRITDAMNEMKYKNTAQGQAIYGPEFLSYDNLVCAHARSVWPTDGDRSHGGPWFFTWHASFVKRFEDILRLIDPAIEGLPYIDWGLDNGVASGSVIFTDTYFGSLKGKRSDGNFAVRGGPFDHWPVSNKHTVDPSDDCQADYMFQDGFYNAYGYLRAQTNTNPSPYVTRMGDKICGNFQICEDKRDECLSKTTLSDYLTCSDINLHMFNHFCVAGTKKRYSFQPPQGPTCLGAQVNLIPDLIGNTGLRHGNNPLYNCWNVPTSCTHSGNDWSGNGCMPVSANPTCDLTAYGLGMYPLPMMETPLFQSWAGDLIDVSTSPNDPLFMFIHNNVERNLQHWKLRNHHLAPLYGYPDNDPNNLFPLDREMYPAESFGDCWQDSIGSPGPYTVEDVMIATEFLNTAYTFDDILDAIEQ